MKIAEFIIQIISQVGPLLIRAARERWGEKRTREEMAALVNYSELAMARDADDKVQGYLESFPKDGRT